MNLIFISRVVHQAIKAYCEGLGDNSQKDWYETTNDFRKSTIDSVTFIKNNPHAGDEALHDNWVEDRIQNGWEYGNIKNEELKTHPCLIDFKDLPKIQQTKDSLFRAVVLSLL